MIRKFHNPKVFSTHSRGRFLTGILTPVWRNVCMALVLALALVSAVQTPSAQAASDNPADIKFEVWAAPEKPPVICINKTKTMKFYVKVYKLIHKTINDTDYDLPRGFTLGFKVYGKTSNDTGQLTPPDVTVGEEELAPLTPGEAVFLFTAKKPGKTTLTFTADVPGIWSGSGASPTLGEMHTAKKAEVQITVRNCNLKATTISTWSAGMTIVATIDDTLMTADDQGNFTGSATVNWTTSAIGSAGCGAESTIAPSKADLTGMINDSDQLVGKVTFQPMSASGIANCGPVSKSTENFGTPDPLTISLASSGGGSRQTQGFTAKNGSFTGSSVIIVVPADDEATTYYPDGQAANAGIPSVWGTTRWDGFPRLFSTLLAIN